MRKRSAFVFLFFAALSGCASYHAMPLDTRPTLLHEVPHLIINAGQMPLPELSSRPFNPDDGLDMTEVSILAVVNNPGLKVARDERKIASAQLIAAGILPNPQLTAALDHPIAVAPGYVNAFNLGLSYDIAALITRNASAEAARAHSLKVDLNVLWQEWQVVQQARLLFVRSMEQEKMMRLLQSYRELFDTRYRRAGEALQEGNLTIGAASADLTALQDAQARINDLERGISKTRHDLNLLVGLSPEVRLRLVGDISLPEPDQTKIKTYLAQLPQRRPDLLALQAGYASQEQRFRKAVLAQFPAFNFGLTRARDTSDINTIGFDITLSLPVFDRNQGNIAIEKATRKRLYDEYQSRLNEAYSMVDRLQAQMKLSDRQYNEVTRILPELELTVTRAEAALEAGNMNITTYTDLQAALLKKRIEAITLEQTTLEQRAALQTLLGSELHMDIAPAEIQFDEKGN